MELIIMTCALTAGYTLPCTDGVGGIKEVRFIEWENVESVTAATGVITAFTLTAGKKFFRYELPSQNKDFWAENEQISNENGTIYYEQDLQVSVRKMSATLRNELRLLAQNRLAAIVTDRNGKHWFLGEANALEKAPSTSGSGAGRGEFNGYVMKFKAMEEAPAQEVNIADMTTITN